MAFSYDLGIDAGKVRLVIADSREEGHILEDAEIDAFLEMNGGSIRLAAADALETIASNESLVQKAMRLLDLVTDGPKVAADLRKHAAVLRSQAAQEDGGLGTPAWAWTENPPNLWAAQEYAWNQAVAHA